MYQIPVYADSLNRGIIPETRGRFGFDQMWPRVVKKSRINWGLFPIFQINAC